MIDFFLWFGKLALAGIVLGGTLVLLSELRPTIQQWRERNRKARTRQDRRKEGRK